MSIPKKLNTILALAAGTALAFTSVSFAQNEEEADDEIVELSQFVIRADEDTGYRAASTLAGTRLRTPIRDVGSSISILTSKLFEDTGATDAETILGYATGMEVHGVQRKLEAASLLHSSSYLD